MRQFPPFCHFLTDGLYWFRLFGYGLAIKNTHKHELLFSEREGYTKTLRIGKYSIKLLKPSPFNYHKSIEKHFHRMANEMKDIADENIINDLKKGI